jgi:hypothetical protein
MKLTVRLTFLLLIAYLLLAAPWRGSVPAGLAVGVAADQDPSPSPPPASSSDLDRILKWVQDLDSDRFLDRELATTRLIEAGTEAIGPVSQALESNNLEVTTRGVHILQELALESDLAISKAARAALEKVATPRVTSAARRAAEALSRLDMIRHERALLDLRQLGAVIDESHSPLGFQMIEQLSIEIGEQWRGKSTDLVRLTWLRSVDQLILSHPQCDDETLALAAQIPDLPALTIRRANVSNDGIAHLRQLDNLRTLNVLYCPIGDETVASLREIASLGRLRLFGTRVSAEGRQRLVEALPQTEIDVRSGAFLGVGCDPTQVGCIINTVRPDTAAERAGLQVGDLIANYEGQAVRDFEELTKAIAQNSPGETVTLQIVRGDQTIERQLELGAWESLD